MSQVTALILAAGEGKRMQSDKAKVLHELCGKPLIEWVYEAAANAGIDRCVVIVGHRAEQIIEYMGDRVEYAYQKQQLGTGHAVQQARSYFKNVEGYIVVLCGDAPLITSDTIKKALDYTRAGGYNAVVISAEVSDPFGYGRIVRNPQGDFLKIVEHRDASEEEKLIREINSGLYVFSARELSEVVNLLTNNNNQKEYYLTDTLEILMSKGYKVGVFKVRDSDEILGVNDRTQLEKLSGIMEKKIKQNISEL